MYHSRRALHVGMQTGFPLYLEGPPGTGKTRHIYACARKLGWKIHVLVGSQCDPTDFGGVMWVDQELKIVRRLPVGAWVHELLSGNEKWLIFLDEWPNTAPATRAAMLKFKNEGLLGDTQLPLDRIQFIGAGNSPEHSPAASEFDAASANRDCHLNWTVDNSEWLEGTRAGWPEPQIPVLPQNWKSFIVDARGLVSSFLNLRLHLCHAIPKEKSKQGLAWPSYRTWEDGVYAMIAACMSINADDDIMLELVCGCVGTGAGVEFIQWKKNLDLPSAVALLHDPSSFRPEKLRIDQLYAVVQSIAAEFLRDATVDNWKAMWILMEKVVECGNKSVAATIVKMVYPKKPTTEQAPATLAKLLPVLQLAEG